MKQFLNVKSTADKIANLEVNIDTVYIRSKINRIENEDFKGWQYDEIQYSLREYQEILGTQNQTVTEDVDLVAQMVVMSIDDVQMLADTISYLLDGVQILKEAK